jgi:hypothetical protein
MTGSPLNSSGHPGGGLPGYSGLVEFDLNARTSMSRFKEGRRITAAIEAKNRKELEWAEGYCRSRLALASRKDHIKHWQALLRQISEARGEND